MRQTLEIGSEWNMLDSDELDAVLSKHYQQWLQNAARSVKYSRFGPAGTAVASSAVTFDGSGNAQNTAIGPRDGFVWSIKRLAVSGLATGTTPDVVNLYRNKPSGTAIWQFNGNNFAYTFGKGEMILLPGETLSFASSGTLAATGQITITGDYVQAAAEELWKIL